MVRVGFIVEGDTEKIIVESATFRAWAKAQGIEVCTPVINAKGGGNLLPHHIMPMLASLQPAAPDHIVILTDLDDAADVASVKARIGTDHTSLVFVAVKAIEAWFLADSAALKKWLKVDAVHEATPEAGSEMPWDRLKALAVEQGARGPGNNKPLFAMKMCKHYGFELSAAATHGACPSSALFHDALVDLGGLQPLLKTTASES